MAKDKDERSLREYGNRKKRLKQIRKAVIGILLLSFVGLGAAYLINLYNRDYEGYEVVNTIEIAGRNTVGYLRYGNALVKYSKDGAVAVAADGELLWNGSYEMSDPIADTCDKYVVVADRGGKTIHIFNSKGLAGSLTTIHNIVKVEVASQGVVAVLTEDGNDNYIHLYDEKGTTLVEMDTTKTKEGYPLDISLSEDGLKLVTSYLSITNGGLINNVAFYNFGEVGQNMIDNNVGGIALDEGIIVPRVAFVNNNTVCIFKNDGFKLFAMDEIPELGYQENIEGKIQSIIYSKKYIGMVVEDKESLQNKLLVYDLKGKQVLNKRLDFDYDEIYLVDEEVIMYNEMSCMIMKMNGKVKFRNTFENSMEALYPINNLDRYFLLSESGLSQILLVE